jgi:hypothetical protein
VDLNGSKIAERDQRTVPEAETSKHREMHYPVFGFATCKTSASDTLEFGPMFVEIVESLVLCLKCRRETTGLPNGTKREHECNDLPLTWLGFGDDPHTFGHQAAF